MRIALRDLNVHSALLLSPSEREWIHSMKFSRLLARRDLEVLASLAAHELKNISSCPFDAVISLPSHPLRSLLQVDLAFEWSQCVAKASGRPLLRGRLAHASLPRALLATPQKRLSVSERRARYADPHRSERFKAKPLITQEPPRILLCDDVLNSGTSFLEAHNALSKQGYQIVAGLVLASTRPALQHLDPLIS